MPLFTFLSQNLSILHNCKHWLLHNNFSKETHTNKNNTIQLIQYASVYRVRRKQDLEKSINVDLCKSVLHFTSSAFPGGLINRSLVSWLETIKNSPRFLYDSAFDKTTRISLRYLGVEKVGSSVRFNFNLPWFDLTYLLHNVS